MWQALVKVSNIGMAAAIPATLVPTALSSMCQALVTFQCFISFLVVFFKDSETEEVNFISHSYILPSRAGESTKSLVGQYLVNSITCPTGSAGPAFN